MTTSFDDFAAFATDHTPAQVITRLEKILAARGFIGYAIGVLPSPPDFQPQGFLHHNWPETFSDVYTDGGYGPGDPSLIYAMTQSRPITVATLASGRGGVDIGPDQRRVIDLGEAHGRNHGAIIPIFGPQGYRAIAAFMRPKGDPDMAEMTELRLLALCAHDRLADLHHADVNSAKPGAPLLSDREREVLILARSGAKDADIAAHLGISLRTVRFHFSNIRTHLKAPTRAAALATAMNLHLL